MGLREPLAHEIVTAMGISLGEYLSSQYSFTSRRYTLALVVVKVRYARPVRRRQRVCSGANPLISGVTAPGRGQSEQRVSPGGLIPGVMWWRWGRVELSTERLALSHCIWHMQIYPALWQSSCHSCFALSRWVGGSVGGSQCCRKNVLSEAKQPLTCEA
jgi:hypothetical protein